MTTAVDLYREIDDLQERLEDDVLWEKWETFWEGWEAFGGDEGS